MVVRSKFDKLLKPRIWAKVLILSFSLEGEYAQEDIKNTFNKENNICRSYTSYRQFLIPEKSKFKKFVVSLLYKSQMI